jgi:N,N'-diacetyllegionaminate synthase
MKSQQVDVVDECLSPVVVGGRRIGPGEPVFVIAEAGVNHNGDPQRAKKMVDAAAEAGADAVKFQTFSAERLVTAAALEGGRDDPAAPALQSQIEMLRRLELSPQAHRELHSLCEARRILFLSTPFDERSADLLEGLGVLAFKIGSGELTHLAFLDYIARKRKPVMLSTGMAYLSEVDEATRVIRNAGCDQLILLHCVSAYPAAPSQANLRAMRAMSEAFQMPVGYSDHTLGSEVALAAVALGACVIEKHFTLDRTLPGPDHHVSLEPRELGAMVRSIRTVERALGRGIKEPGQSELANRIAVRRSLVAVQNIPAGTRIHKDMITAKRPATGLPPGCLDWLIGRRARVMITANQFILPEMVE